MDKIYMHQIQESLNDKCWRLSSYLLSQYDIKELSHPWKEYWCIFENNFKQSFKNIFFKEFIEISALIRALLDIDDIKIPKEFAGISTQVGTITCDNGKEKELTFRDACNKIIHSKKYSVSFLWSEQHPLCNGKSGCEASDSEKFKNPIISTEGDYHGKTWVAKIEFFKFIDQALNLPEA